MAFWKNKSYSDGAVPTPLQQFEVHRSYIVHEDNLINNRVSWFIQLHSFLIATYGLVTSSLVDTYFPDTATKTDPLVILMIQLLLCILLFGITVVGTHSSNSAITSVKAASESIERIEARWKLIEAGRADNLNLFPDLAGGGSDEIVQDGAVLQGRLPTSINILWQFSIAVPIAFFALGVAQSKLVF